LALAEANAAAREYSATLLERELGASLVIDDGGTVWFDQATSLGPGLIGIIEHLMHGTPDAPEPGVPSDLLRVAATQSAVVFGSIGRHHRYIRRLDEHLRRIGWLAPSLDLVFLGPGGVWSAPTCARRLVVQVIGAVEHETGSGVSRSIDAGAGCATAAQGVDLRSNDRLSVSLSVSARGVDEPPLADPGSHTFSAASRPAVSSASLRHVLNLEELRFQRRLVPRGLTVRSHHPGGAFGIASSAGDFVSGGVVWSTEPGLTSAVGRLLSGPPVSADEFAELASISGDHGVEALIQMIRAGLCEPCVPPEPLI
jgi:hypothetical protein